jgi:hypothetical protein
MTDGPNRFFVNKQLQLWARRPLRYFVKLSRRKDAKKNDLKETLQVESGP